MFFINMSGNGIFISGKILTLAQKRREVEVLLKPKGQFLQGLRELLESIQRLRLLHHQLKVKRHAILRQQIGHH